MKVLVCGSRDWLDEKSIHNELSKLSKDVIIIHGGCPAGADKIADDYCKINNLKTIIYLANWKTYGRSAGPIRNKEMIEKESPDLVLAFLKNNSKGTKNTITLAELNNIKTLIIKC